MSDEWGPWIEHDGKGCPCRGLWVRAEWDWGGIDEGIAGSHGGESWDWAVAEAAGFWRVIRYRVRKPRGLTILEEIAQGVKQPEDA